MFGFEVIEQPIGKARRTRARCAAKNQRFVGTSFLLELMQETCRSGGSVGLAAHSFISRVAFSDIAAFAPLLLRLVAIPTGLV